MKDLDRLIARWREFGGWRLVWQYAKMGVLWIGVKEIIRCAVTGRSFKTLYPVLTERIAPLLLPPAGGVPDHLDNQIVEVTLMPPTVRSKNDVAPLRAELLSS